MQLRIATYNIHACIGTDGVFDPMRIAQVIRSLNVDVIALQEVEHHLIDNIDLLDFLAQQTDMIAIAGPTLSRETRDYGNAILTKRAIDSIELIDLSIELREPRGAIALSLSVESYRLFLVATHFGLKPAERHYQSQRLFELFQQNDADYQILLGDLNEWFPWRSTSRRLKQYFGKTPSHRSFPSFFPLFALDRILVKSRQHLTALSIDHSRLAKKASDHLPLIAKIQI